MNRTRIPRGMREQRLNRRLMIALAAVLFIGVIAQIAMMAQLAIQSKQAYAAEKEAYDLTIRIENLNNSLEQFHSHDRIKARARQLGMQLPDETQLRVVNLPGLTYGTTAQSADNGGAGEMLD